jgi:hypothetical protein
MQVNKQALLGENVLRRARECELPQLIEVTCRFSKAFSSISQRSVCQKESWCAVTELRYPAD